MVRSADESHDVLLLQRTEIETPDNPPEEHPECSPDTLLKNMLSYCSSALYESQVGAVLGGARLRRGRQEPTFRDGLHVNTDISTLTNHHEL